MEIVATEIIATMSTSTTLDFTFRMIESIAFSLHALLGITEPCTGCLRGAFGDNNNMVWWGWPVAGFVLACCAYGNFAFQNYNAVVLFIQWYIVTFHFGAIWYHIRLGHHPAVGLAPGIFIPFALTVIAVRLDMEWWWSLVILPVGTIVCAVISFGLCRILVRPPSQEEPLLLQR
mmetsp:Transcript_25935/g.36912  ORF Transcript_25935/g.36912 Transcript_25935/m.36912 type:complete len:175 (+) Transcript_25935:33-557(+)